MSPATKPANDYASTVYQQLCTSHQAIDEFRLKVLGFLPLATGTGFLFLFNSKDLGIGYWQGPGRPLLLPIGIFGFLITAGLFLYEIYCIRKCESFIQAGQRLESEMNVVGPFRSRKDIFWPVAAAGIIYPGVLAVWAALILYSSTSSPAAHQGLCRIGFHTSTCVGRVAFVWSGQFCWARSRCTMAIWSRA